jgi:hypothetical protein
VTAPLAPKAMANRLSHLLTQVLGPERFPVAVAELAVEYSRQCFPGEPIDRVQGEDLEGFEGMLTRHPSGTKWLLLYNSGSASEGRQRFTIAHEFGHYLLHRQRQAAFNCGDDDIAAGRDPEGDLEGEADEFAATLLMPLDDFRRQVAGQPVDFDLLSRCADRYGVSLTAATLRWLDVAPGRAVLVVSRGANMLWAKASAAAFRSGLYFATRQRTVALPPEALAHPDRVWTGERARRIAARAWFEGEPEDMTLTEMTRVAGSYDQTLTLLHLPAAERVWRREEDDEGGWMPGKRMGPPPVRSLNPSK